MNPPHQPSKRPLKVAWTLERLLHERSLALGFTLASSTGSCYDSAFASYIEFCRLHDRPLTPSVDTLSFFIVWLSSYILPRSVNTYLSGICSKLENDFAEVRQVRQHRLVQRCLRRHQQPVHRREPLSRGVLLDVYLQLSSSCVYDDLLFLTILHVGFETLQRLGELVWPDALKLRSYSSVAMCHTVNFSDDSFSYTLPGSKTDRFGHGSQVLVRRSSLVNDCHSLFAKYLRARDALFLHHPQLWLWSSGDVPTRSWFIQKFRAFTPHSNFSGHSMRAGGATSLALAGATPHLIQAAGRWSSSEFQKYVRVHPFLLQALIHSDNI